MPSSMNLKESAGGKTLPMILIRLPLANGSCVVHLSFGVFAVRQVAILIFVAISWWDLEPRWVEVRKWDNGNVRQLFLFFFFFFWAQLCFCFLQSAVVRKLRLAFPQNSLAIALGMPWLWTLTGLQPALSWVHCLLKNGFWTPHDVHPSWVRNCGEQTSQFIFYFHLILQTQCFEKYNFPCYPQGKN